jgi:hypothetical protein
MGRLDGKRTVITGLWSVGRRPGYPETLHSTALRQRRNDLFGEHAHGSVGVVVAHSRLTHLQGQLGDAAELAADEWS